MHSAPYFFGAQAFLANRWQKWTRREFFVGNVKLGKSRIQTFESLAKVRANVHLGLNAGLFWSNVDFIFFSGLFDFVL